jgi:hypothetical protein
MSRSLWRVATQQLRSATQRAATTQRASLSVGHCHSSSATGQQRLRGGGRALVRLDQCRGYHWRRDGDIIGLASRSFARTRRRFSTSPKAQHGHIDPPKPGEEYVIGVGQYIDWLNANLFSSAESRSHSSIRKANPIPSKSPKATIS